MNHRIQDPLEYFPYNLRKIHRMLASPQAYHYQDFKKNIWSTYNPIKNTDFVLLPYRPSNPGSRTRETPFITLEFLLRILEQRFSNPNAKALYFRLVDEHLQATA